MRKNPLQCKGKLMPQKKDNEQTSPVVKRLQTDVKGGQGSFFLAMVVSLIYVVRALLAKNFSFFFSLFVPELLLKSAAFTADYSPTFDAHYSVFFAEHLHGKVPNAAVWIALACIYGACLMLAILARNRHMLVIGELVIYGVDTLLVWTCHLLSFPEAFSLNALIDPIFHLFVLILLIRSAAATVKLKKSGFTEEQMNFY